MFWGVWVRLRGVGNRLKPWPLIWPCMQAGLCGLRTIYPAAPQSLVPLLEFHERDMAAGMMDAPWPPVYPKQPNEPPRVAPSRAKKPD